MPDLRPPRLRTQSSYARKFQDPRFWQPYVDEVLRRHDLPPHIATLGTGGSFPTFLVGAYVVKFFGQQFEGVVCSTIERTLHTGILPRLQFATSSYVGHGTLFQTGWPWPYMVTRRLEGTAWRQMREPPDDWRVVVASELGTAVRQIHAVECPDEPVWKRDVVGALRANCTERQRRLQMLPSILVDQIDEYLAPASTQRVLVHADLHGDHIFVRDGHLAGVIDWGDALCGDPYYDLPALFFGTFGGCKALLRQFLDSYGWPVGPDFARRALTMTLVHEFNPLGNARHLIPFVATLRELADSLWGL